MAKNPKARRGSAGEDDQAAAALDVLSRKLPEDVDELDDDDDALEGELLDDAEDQADDVDEPDVPDDLVFTTDEDKYRDDKREVLILKLDGAELCAQKPSKGAWTMILGSVSGSATEADKAQAILNFMFTVFDEPSKILLQQRFLSNDDPFDIDDLSKIISRLIERWAPAQSRAQRRAAMQRKRRPARR